MNNNPKVTTCEICGRIPSAPVKLQSASSRIIWWVRSSIDSNLCGMCAEMAYFTQQSKTFKQGWWGPLSALATIWFGITNIFAIKNHREVVREVSSESGAVARPHLSIRNDNLTMIGLAVGVIAWIGFGSWFFSQPSSTYQPPSVSVLWSCWADTSADKVKQVDCSDKSATYQVYRVSNNLAECEDSYVELDGQYGCLRRFN